MAKLRAERKAEGFVELTITLTPANAAKAARLAQAGKQSVSALVNRLIEKTPTDDAP
jgi:hypothetical protein